MHIILSTKGFILKLQQNKICCSNYRDRSILIINARIHPQINMKNGGSHLTATITNITIKLDYVRALRGLLTAARTVVKFLDVPHLTIGSRVHDEVAHIRTSYRQLEAQEQRHYR
jgi:hypothetical protein